MGLRTEFREIFLRKPTVSFCITCRNRMWQIEQTLPQNLKDNYANRKNVEFILVNFASEDGLDEWVRENFREELRSGYLKYYYSDKMGPWHMSVAKNTAHMLATKEVVVNLDCDNFTGPDGGREAARLLNKYGRNRSFLRFCNNADATDGSYGRVVVLKKIFMQMGGYDETFLPYGGEDDDFMCRLRAKGLRHRDVRHTAYSKFILNEKYDGIDRSKWDVEPENMGSINLNKCEENIRCGRLVANLGKEIGVSAERRYAK